jgi:hypothetical protein
MGRHAIDLTGQWFGRLEVLHRANVEGADRAAWLCRCRCGNQTTVLTHNLRTGRTTSCGCALADANKARASKPIRQVGHMKLVAERKPKPKGVVRNITHQGKSQGLQDWARELGMSYQAIQYRLDNGWSVKRALTTPSRKHAPVSAASRR